MAAKKAGLVSPGEKEHRLRTGVADHRDELSDGRVHLAT